MSGKSGTVFMEVAGGLERECRVERCPVRIQFEYKRGIKTKMEVEVSKDGTRNTFIRVLVKDEYSFGQDVERVLEDILRQEGVYVEINEVEAKKVLQKI